jgi:hypothetical protein
VQRCFKRFDRSFSGEEKVVAPATTSYGIDKNWYANSGATNHITSDLDKLSIRDKFQAMIKCISLAAQVWRSNTLVILLYIHHHVI